MTLVDRFRAHLASLSLQPGRAIVAVSGGPDSMALLDLLARTHADHRLELAVAHVDHGIHPASSQARRAVERAALDRGLPFDAEVLELGAVATETAARVARYAALERIRVRRAADWILLAHHADDQVETVLMRVLRGSGPAGLAGMSARRGRLVRPLLPFRREELAQYLRDGGIAAWTDAANADPRHLRSWIREDVLPRIQERLVDVRGALESVGRQASRNREAWRQVLDQLPGLDVEQEASGISVAAPVLAGYDSELATEIVRTLGRQAGCVIGEVRAERLLALARGGESGRSVPLGAGWRGELAFGRLRIVPDTGLAPSPVSLSGHAGELRWGRWRLRVRQAAAPERQERRGMTAWFADPELTVRGPRAGERLAPLGGRGRRLLVRCFQDAQVPRGERGSWPVLEVAGTAIWVPGVCRAAALIPPAGSEAWRVDVTHE